MAAGDYWPDPADQSLPAAVQPASFSGSLGKVREEWIAFYDTHYYRVVRFMILAGATPDDAQDAAQEAFTESWKLMSRDPADWQAIAGKAAWVRTTALRKHARPPGRRRRPLTSGAASVPDQPAPGLSHDELTAQTQAVLQALGCLDRQARAVMAFDLDGMTTAETARALNIGEQRVRDVKKKARAALKRQLAATTAAPEGRQP